MTTLPVADNDKKFLDLCIEKAGETFKKDNYPVGAALVIDGKLVDVIGNQIKGRKSFVYHAENQLIIENAVKLYEAFESGKSIVLYSTLEPCIQCLGAAVTNQVNRIVYIQKDPNGGACDLRHDNIGLFYKDKWPDIVWAPISNKPLDLMLEFFHLEIDKGNIKWPSKMLSLLEK
jgi:tRNA(Arg) A34 adenosine deaminase TadA